MSIDRINRSANIKTHEKLCKFVPINFAENYFHSNVGRDEVRERVRERREEGERERERYIERERQDEVI